MKHLKDKKTFLYIGTYNELKSMCVYKLLFISQLPLSKQGTC